jgi:hypothetical protein
MNIDKIKRQMADQRAAMRAFPSQTNTLEQMHSGQNQRAAVELQIGSTNLISEQNERSKKMYEALIFLSEWARQNHLATLERDKIEDQRSLRNTRYSQIAAWTGVIAIILAVIALFK